MSCDKACVDGKQWRSRPSYCEKRRFVESTWSSSHTLPPRTNVSQTRNHSRAQSLRGACVYLPQHTRCLGQDLKQISSTVNPLLSALISKVFIPVLFTDCLLALHEHRSAKNLVKLTNSDKKLNHTPSILFLPHTCQPYKVKVNLKNIWHSTNFFLLIWS